MIKNNNGTHLRSILAILLTSLIICSALLSGCAAKKGSSRVESAPTEKVAGTVQKDSQEEMLTEFRKLLSSNTKPDSMIVFIDSNISKVTKENASMFINELEKIQQKYLTQLEQEYFNGVIQNKISKAYKPGFDLNTLDNIQDKELKEFLTATRNMGYRVETAEGMYFPTINYEFNKKYSPYVTVEMKDYIDIMAVESNKVPAKDAALVIGWDEVIKRALAQEAFIKNYRDSIKTDDVKKLHKKYITFILYGLNNTPLFSYESKIIVPGAKTVYLNVIKNSTDSNLVVVLGKYMDLLSKTNYILSDSADKFRKEVLETYN